MFLYNVQTPLCVWMRPLPGQPRVIFKLKLDKGEEDRVKIGTVISVSFPHTIPDKSLFEAIISSCFGSWVIGIIIYPSMIHDSSFHHLRVFFTFSTGMGDKGRF